MTELSALVLGRIWLLPASLDRKFSLKEKLSVWLFGDHYTEDFDIHIKPYALARKFNKDGYTKNNPYLWIGFFGNLRHLMNEEMRYSPVCIKSDVARRYHEQDMARIKEDLRALSLIRKFRL
jgi:hypothetical protein